MIIKHLTPDDSLWPQLLQTLRHDTYHLPAYVALDANKEAVPVEAVVVIEDEHAFCVPYMTRACDPVSSSSPMATQSIFDAVSPAGYSGIILSDAAKQNPTFIQNAMEAMVISFQKKGICSAFFRQHPLLGPPQDKQDNPIDFIHNGVTVSVDLTLSEAKIWAHTRKGHQSTINKCKRLGLSARMVPFSEYLEPFIEIYTETMNRVSAQQGYYYDPGYFESLLTLGDALHCCIVEQQDVIVAASLFFECCGIVQAHLGGTRTQYMPQSPFSLLLHYARLWAKERGNTHLHLGGGVGGSDQDALFKFKSGFSRQRHDLYTLRLIIHPEWYQALVAQRAQTLNASVEQLVASNFFPAYRSSAV